MKVFRLFFLLSALLLSILNSALAAETVGFVKSVSGDVYFQSGETKVKAVPLMHISLGDHISTAEQSSIGLIFEDDTVVSLGPNSTIIIEKFLFNPVEEELSFVARMIKGTFSFITGQIAKLAPKQVKLETPDATLGIRGTKFLVKID